MNTDHGTLAATDSGNPSRPVDRGQSMLDQATQRLINQATRDQRKHAVTSVAYPALAAIAGLIAWQLAISVFSIPAYLLPTPLRTLEACWNGNSQLLAATGVTAKESLIGFGVSIAVGVPLGVALAMSTWFSKSVYPLLVTLNAVPKVALAPIIIVWMGFGIQPKILIAALAAFFPILINTALGLAAIAEPQIDLARSIGLSAVPTFFKIRLPNALPTIFGGLKLGSQLAVIGALVGELVGADRGLGKILMDANSGLDISLVFADLVYLTIFSVALFGAVQLVEKVAIPWQSSAGSKRNDRN